MIDTGKNYTAYLENLLPEHPAKWQEMERFSSNNKVPIMEPVSMHFLLQLLRLHQPGSILEVGTAIGYSACRMAETLLKVKITTMERDPQMVQYALQNINNLGYSRQITLMQGDALDIMGKLVDEKVHFDCIFIDAAKGQYKRFFQLADMLLKPKGLMICDNVLFRGLVVDPDSAASPRHKELAMKLQAFNKELTENKAYDTSLVPIGDGVSISIKRNGAK
jgi:predicted O-methyltransferase YrrM